MAWPRSLVHNTEDKHQLSSPLHLQSSSWLTLIGRTDRSFFSFRSHQLLWGRSPLQILLFSATTNLKAHHCPLSAPPILAYVWNTCLLSPSLGRQREAVVCVACCSLAATLLEPGCWLLCWWFVCFSDCSLFVLTSRTCSLVLLMKTVSWEQCPLFYGHYFK